MQKETPLSSHSWGERRRRREMGKRKRETAGSDNCNGDTEQAPTSSPLLPLLRVEGWEQTLSPHTGDQSNF